MRQRMLKRFVCLLMVCVMMIPKAELQAKTVKKDGSYYTWARTSGVDEYNLGLDYHLKKAIFKGNKVTTYGNFVLQKKLSVSPDDGKKIKAKKRTFKIAKSCTYWDGFGVPDDLTKLTKKQFIKRLQGSLGYEETATCFVVQVKHGKVVKMLLGQA